MLHGSPDKDVTVDDLGQDDDAISGLEEPFPDYEDRIDIMMNDEVNKEMMMDGMRVFDTSNLDNFHTYNLNVETGKRLKLDDGALEEAFSSSDESDDEQNDTDEK